MHLSACSVRGIRSPSVQVGMSWTFACQCPLLLNKLLIVHNPAAPAHVRCGVLCAHTLLCCTSGDGGKAESMPSHDSKVQAGAGAGQRAPQRAAKCRAVQPARLRASAGQPLRMNRATGPLLPPSAAAGQGVLPWLSTRSIMQPLAISFSTTSSLRPASATCLSCGMPHLEAICLPSAHAQFGCPFAESLMSSIP